MVTIPWAWLREDAVQGTRGEGMNARPRYHAPDVMRLCHGTHLPPNARNAVLGVMAQLARQAARDIVASAPHTLLSLPLVNALQAIQQERSIRAQNRGEGGKRRVHLG